MIDNPMISTENLANILLECSELYLVGGTVRDIVLYKKYNTPFIHRDFDFVTNKSLEQIVEFLHDKGIKTKIKGKICPVIKIKTDKGECQITSFGGRPELFDDIDSVSDDMLNRDFRISAMAIDCNDISTFDVYEMAKMDIDIIDPYGFIKDIDERVIDTVLEPSVVFGRDPLLMMRAVRLMSVTGFEISERVRAYIEENAHNIIKQSGFRKLWEIEKMSEGNYMYEAFSYLFESGLFKHIFPFLNEYMDNIEKAFYYLNSGICDDILGDVDNHIVLIISMILMSTGMSNSDKHERAFWMFSHLDGVNSNERRILSIIARSNEIDINDVESSLRGIIRKFHKSNGYDDWIERMLRYFLTSLEISSNVLYGRSDNFVSLVRYKIDEILQNKHEFIKLRGVDGNLIRTWLSEYPVRLDISNKKSMGISIGEVYQYLFDEIDNDVSINNHDDLKRLFIDRFVNNIHNMKILQPV